MSIDWMTEQLLRDVDRLRAEVARLGQERDALKVENERLRQALHNAIANVGPWTAHCDYRAEPDLQRAVRILEAALTVKEAGQ